MSLLTWRRGALAAGICAAALALQNAGLRRQLRDRGSIAAPAGARVASEHGRRGTVAAIQPAVGSAAADVQPAAEEPDDVPVARRHWALELVRLREGEDLLAYRDRVLPIAQAVIAPQRARVGDRRREMTARAGLDARQQEELDAAVMDASDEIVNRVWQAVANEELWPRPRPVAGVALAADVLTTVTAADRRFRGALRDDQRAAVDQSGFDLADYLLFSVPWEERFGIGAAPP